MSILIATVEQEVYRGTASMVIVPSVDGEIAIMPGHAPLLATLRPGEVRIDCVDDKGCPCRTDDMVVFGGYVEVQPDGIIILADAIERAKDIDEARAKQAVVHAKGVLRSSDLEKASKAMLDLELAIAKLRVVRRKRKHPLMKP
jgi:F-type H+-transporting ATPase subunit epsilon